MNDKQRLHSAVTAILGFDPAEMFGDRWDTDWRVAGALIELVGHISVDTSYMKTGKTHASFDCRFYAQNESAPRAIIEACVAALREDEKDV